MHQKVFIAWYRKRKKKLQEYKIARGKELEA